MCSKKNTYCTLKICVLYLLAEQKYLNNNLFQNYKMKEFVIVKSICVL